MKKRFDTEQIKDNAKARVLLFLSIGFLIINLLIFALVLPETKIFSLVLAGAFLVYIPIGLFEKESRFMTYFTRVFEIIVSLTVTLAYIILFNKYFLLILPIIEIAAPILLYFLVFKKRK